MVVIWIVGLLFWEWKGEDWKCKTEVVIERRIKK